MQIFGIILAGGRGSRLGGRDKALIDLAGRSLLDHVASRLGPQVAQMALSANGDPARFDGFKGPVLHDTVAGFAGPLAGILAGMDWAAAEGADFIATASVDTPFLPCDLVPQLYLAAEQAAAPIALARSGGRIHPTCGMWSVSLRDDLRHALASGVRRLGGWAEEMGAVPAQFALQTPDEFFNINTEQDLTNARAALQPDTGLF